MADFPVPSTALASAPLSSSRRTSGSSPEKAAAATGAMPLRPGRLTSAPCAISFSTAVWRPASAATYSAVEPSRSRASISAPFSRNRSTISTSPALAARLSGMAPKRSRAFSDAPSASRRRASATQRLSAAENSAALTSSVVAAGLICSYVCSWVWQTRSLAAGAGDMLAAPSSDATTPLAKLPTPSHCTCSSVQPQAHALSNGSPAQEPADTTSGPLLAFEAGA